MMDLAVPALVGAAGNLIAEAGKKGTAWLIEKYQSHNPAVQKQAKHNAEKFLYRLAQRVDRLEKELPVSQRTLINEAFDHPNTSLLLQKALITASATDNETRHELLTELITQRLTAAPEDTIVLIGSAACDVIGALSARQIKILGLMARLYDLKPLDYPNFNSQQEYDGYLVLWWSSLTPLSQGLEDANGLDLRHLDALSCIRISIGESNIPSLLKRPFLKSSFTPTIDIFKSTEWWSRVEGIMNVGVKYASLTSVGLLLGTLQHDRIIHSKTVMDFK